MLVLTRILEGHLSTAEAAPLLKRSKRQVQRLMAAYRKEGVAAVVHRLDEATRQRIIALTQSTYAGANYQHLHDLLEEREGIVVSRVSVRRASGPSIGAIANATRKRACWCRLMAVPTPG